MLEDFNQAEEMKQREREESGDDFELEDQAAVDKRSAAAFINIGKM